MNGIGTAHANNIIEQKYIQSVLNQEAESIFTEQKLVVDRSGTSTKDIILQKRRFAVTGTTLEVEHAIVQRFIDMKYISGHKRKAIPVHNKVIYNHFNSIINQLAFGFTDSVRALIAQEHKIQI